MSTKLYWAEGPWSGKLALSARPRGGDWLNEDIARWKDAGIDTVLSLLTREEEHDLGLEDEANEVRRSGMRFLSLPIPDMEVPRSEPAMAATLEKLDALLTAGGNVVVHCRQGIGRTGLIAACLLVTKGISSGAAVEAVSVARGLEVPETPEQRRWIDHYAATLAGTK